MIDDPAVRSIRVAAALNDRFGAILREADGLMEAPEAELRIGEAQQLYPEIWRHLDDARAALAPRGVALDAYDEVRAREPIGQQAVTDISHVAGINPLALVVGQLEYVNVKTAKFHSAGHARAREACAALMRALPAVDWDALARAEAAELAAAGSLQTGRWRQLALAAAVIVVAWLVYAWLG